MNGIYEVPECYVVETDEKSAEEIVGGSMLETIVGSVASGVASGVSGGIVVVAVDAVPGPAVPG